MTPEGAIVKAAMDYLAAKRIPAWRMNTGGMKGVHKGKHWFVRFGVRGMADILAALPAVEASGAEVRTFMWIECKTAKGIQSDDQVNFEQYVKDYDMEYLLIRSVDELIAAIAEVMK